MPKAIVCIVLGVVAGILSPTLAARELPDFTALVDQNAPAVVNISTVGEVERPRWRGRRNEELDEFFRFFMPPDRGERRQPSRSLGSGFIVSADGLILTNHHVVDGASEIIVRFSDRRELVAELVGSDPRSDLAVLKVETDDDLPTVEIGSSEVLRVGEWVLAIGSPFGFDYSVTAGIVSAKGRSLPTRQNENYVPYIQTDVAINPGNSGGPLFNLDGQVIGINAQIYSNSGGFMGVSFAIPIDVAMDVAQQLQDAGRVSRGWLGVMIQEVNRDLAESFGLDRPHGALISRVIPDTPAAQGGLVEGDIITRFNGHAIERSSELPQRVGRVRAGQSAEVELVRDGRVMRLDLKVGELADLAADGSRPELTALQPDRLGLVVEALSPEEQERLDVSGGVRVRSVEGSAEEAGVRPGDVLTRLNNLTVTSVSEYRDAEQSLEADVTVAVLVLRNRSPVFLPIRVPE